MQVTLNPLNQKPLNQKAAAEEQEPFRVINVDETKKLLEQGSYQLIDVREPYEYATGHLPGARLVPLRTLLNLPQQFLKTDDIVFVCASGERSAVACEMAAALGFKNIYNVKGGTSAWRAKGYPIEK
jgi:rhodanese-related sulfurtransferase